MTPANPLTRRQVLADAQTGEAVSGGPAWERTALVVNYDEWGGFYDHVAPTTAPDAAPELGTDLRGFCTPALLISPRARRHHVSHRRNLADLAAGQGWRVGGTV